MLLKFALLRLKHWGKGADKQFDTAPLKNLTTHELFELCVSYVR
jgi:hypothetical protein